MSPKFAIRKLKISVSIAITSLIDIVVFSFRESVYVIFYSACASAAAALFA